MLGHIEDIICFIVAQRKKNTNKRKFYAVYNVIERIKLYFYVNSLGTECESVDSLTHHCFIIYRARWHGIRFVFGFMYINLFYVLGNDFFFGCFEIIEKTGVN